MGVIAGRAFESHHLICQSKNSPFGATNAANNERGPWGCRTLIPQPEGPHTVVEKALRYEFRSLRGQQRCTTTWAEYA